MERKTNSKSYRFDVAFSFPGEKRQYVEKVDAALVSWIDPSRVFYDKRFEAEISGFNADLILQNIYHEQSKLIVLFLCKEYEQKEWCCNVEWRAIRDLIKKRKRDILPLRFDESDIPGIYSIDICPDIKNRTPEETAVLIRNRLGRGGGRSPVSISPNQPVLYYPLSDAKDDASSLPGSIFDEAVTFTFPNRRITERLQTRRVSGISDTGIWWISDSKTGYLFLRDSRVPLHVHNSNFALGKGEVWLDGETELLTLPERKNHVIRIGCGSMPNPPLLLCECLNKNLRDSFNGFLENLGKIASGYCKSCPSHMLFDELYWNMLADGELDVSFGDDSEILCDSVDSAISGSMILNQVVVFRGSMFVTGETSDKKKSDLKRIFLVAPPHSHISEYQQLLEDTTKGKHRRVHWLHKTKMSSDNLSLIELRIRVMPQWLQQIVRDALAPARYWASLICKLPLGTAHGRVCLNNIIVMRGKLPILKLFGCVDAIMEAPVFLDYATLEASIWIDTDNAKRMLEGSLTGLAAQFIRVEAATCLGCLSKHSDELISDDMRTAFVTDVRSQVQQRAEELKLSRNA